MSGLSALESTSERRLRPGLAIFRKGLHAILFTNHRIGSLRSKAQQIATTIPDTGIGVIQDYQGPLATRVIEMPPLTWLNT